MRFVVLGAGAVGGVVGARLFEHGHDVVLVARGRHGQVIRERGLTVQSPAGPAQLPIACVSLPREVTFRPDDVVLLAVKSQQTPAALEDLAGAAPSTTPVVCLQNGMVNERMALRRFANVYGVPVICPTLHLEPGLVAAYSAPVTGILDIGRYPRGVDEVATGVAAAFQASTFSSHARPDILRWKWGKLLSNLGNAIEALCGPDARHGELGALVRAEADACLGAAEVDVVPDQEADARVAGLVRMEPVGGAKRPGGSSWQSLARRAGSVETDYLNGEIVLLGRLHGVKTPANELLQRLARELAASGAAPGTVTEQELLARLADGG